MRALIAAALLLPASALAQTVVNVPQVMGYQGRLLKDGNPETGQVSISFRLYSSEVAGEPLWTEKQTVQLANGFYAVFLGSQTPFPSGAFDGNTRWLELQVEGDSAPLTPRQQIASVAYAFQSSRAVSSDTAARAGTATSADTATNVAGAGSVGAASGTFTGAVRAGSVTASTFTGALKGNADSATSAVTAANVAGAGTVNASSGSFTGNVSAANFTGPLSGKASSAGYADSAGGASVAGTATNVSGGGSVSATSGTFGSLTVAGTRHFTQDTCQEVVVPKGVIAMCPAGYYVAGITGAQSGSWLVYSVTCCN